MSNLFGMFIHWGIYAQLGVQEQVYARYDMKRDDYEKYQQTFNPVNYDPEKWVMLAKNAGMKYICFTTKHHDGFCMWNTKYTDYNIMNTPYGKDVLKMLSDACKNHDMKLGLYYSLPDWHHPLAYNPASTHQWKAVSPELFDTVGYREYVKNQITELLTGYGPIYSLFWDIPPCIEDTSINQLAKSLQPGILINDRGYDEGDFSTPEREYKSNDTEGERFTHLTEACNSIGEQSWGYRKEEDYYSFRYLTHAIDRFMSMGASYLLNIGPMGDGSIDLKHQKRIDRIGDWYNRMAGCLEDNESDDFDYQLWKRKCNVTKKNGKTYFHFCNGIPSTSVSMRNYPSLPQKVVLLNTGLELPFAVEPLPEYYNKEGKSVEKFLHIREIPVDELENESIVVEVSWSGDSVK